jgi:biotin carboxyl carrier protein
MKTREINDAIQTFQPERHYEPGDIIKILELMKAMNDKIAEIEARLRHVVIDSGRAL